MHTAIREMYMVISRPEKKSTTEKEIDIESLIDRGAKVKHDRDEEERLAREAYEQRKQRDKEKWFHINLRIPIALMTKIEKALSRRIGITRNGWLQEAIAEKLRNEGKEES